MIKSFQDLEVYQESKKLYVELVKITVTFPKISYSLGDQIRRASNSVHACIAEGYGRSIAEFKHYLTISIGSNNEVISHLEDAFALGYIPIEVFNQYIDICEVLGKRLFRLRQMWK